MNVVNTHMRASMVRSLGNSAIISTLSVLPFTILELMNNPGSYQKFPVPLFAFMWLLSLAFMLVATPIARSLRANRTLALPLRYWVGIAVLALLAVFWVGIVRDQLPCFLGVPNCD